MIRSLVFVVGWVVFVCIYLSVMKRMQFHSLKMQFCRQADMTFEKIELKEILQGN